ncbi:hypothetical protein SAMN05216353_102127 [Halobacillus alkaliphilus]|uniref:Uncharacterized protein n=1 Tax=Halobacillus alkaliphilus TaxID=396056 RepID=A0A1I2JVI7_9BACI|nr:DUF5412 family protein [Halobacillus alkaliphilus]SFF57890.1 hypothetical protein SAMN05216353_102127 [Halobacillus alkaliphilus]
MGKQYNLWSFYLILVCLGLAAYSLYSNINNTWLIAPPNYILLLISIIALILGVLGFKDKRNWWVETRSWITVIISLLSSIGLFWIVAFTLFFSSMKADEHIQTVSSPGGKYTIEFYSYDAGAAGSFGVRGEINGPLWFKKRIYLQHNVEQVEVEWESNDKLSINSHILKLDEGDTYGYQ